MSSAQEALKENINNIDVDAAAPVDVKEPEANTSTVSPLVTATLKEQAINNNDSIISLEYLKMGGNSSTVVLNKDESKSRENMNLRVEIYRPIQPTQATVEEDIKCELTTTATSSSQHRGIIEEPKVEILSAPVHVAVIEEPRIELISPVTYRALIEEPKMGTLRTFDGDEIIMLSDEIDDFENYHEPHKSIPDVFESADENNNNNISSNLNNSIEFDCSGVVLGPVDSNCCSCTRQVRENETQTPRNRNATRQRARQQGPGTSSMGGVVVGTSSNYDSSEQLPQHKLKINTQPQNTFKQRQLELHRHRIGVEQKRLELLELKIARERDEMIRERILFEKELDLKSTKIRKLTEDRFDL